MSLSIFHHINIVRNAAVRADDHEVATAMKAIAGALEELERHANKMESKLSRLK